MHRVPPHPSGQSPASSTILVGQDRAGHWLVQHSEGILEGRFVSFAAAMSFARAERQGLPGVALALATEPLVPLIPFGPITAPDIALPRAA